jgi:hypothetical protein
MTTGLYRFYTNYVNKLLKLYKKILYRAIVTKVHQCRVSMIFRFLKLWLRTGCVGTNGVEIINFCNFATKAVAKKCPNYFSNGTVNVIQEHFTPFYCNNAEKGSNSSFKKVVQSASKVTAQLASSKALIPF